MHVDPAKAGFDPDRLERITTHLERNYIQSGKIAGCQVAVSRHGQPAYFLSPGAAVSCVQVCASTVYDVEFELVPFVPLKTFDPTTQ